MTEQSDPHIPRWLRFVLKSDRAGSAAYIGFGFLFAPALLVVSPWPGLTTALWIVIALAGLWLGLLGIAMATGLAIVLRSGAEIPEDYWRSIIDYPDAPSPRSPRCSRPASV
ncbi:hypothetical protein [Mycolicibacterium arenosum]|uniref:Sensor domain-containing protein n=1 Tax=Mycolicibacterium arenosum TaxID=2952157 RepID=A0ABT1M7A7_9MYCO|nr:hypothetical protein [Mycolicibacterium sp. CAU 1645]MCP9275058.1 hypothetical protein [Mycolicibacterium sp. CAU 1645]